MVSREDVREALAASDGWQSTVVIATNTRRTARSPMVHRGEVYRVLRRMAEDGEVECYRGMGNEVYWRRVR